MINEIVLGDRREVVELGAGISTIVIARLLRERGGRLHTLEHDPEWERIVRVQLAREALEGVVSLHADELETNAHAWDGAPWYAASAIERLPEQIDLLLVDGPPGHGEGMSHSRFPALPELGERLAPDGVVFLDDATRPAEKEILERWQTENPGWTFGADPATGIAIGRCRA